MMKSIVRSVLFSFSLFLSLFLSLSLSFYLLLNLSSLPNQTTYSTQVLFTLLERLKSDMTRLSAVRAITTIARTPLPLDLTPILPQTVSELTSHLSKANRQLRLSSLTALTALIARDGPRIDPNALELTVTVAAPLVNDVDLAVTASALRLVETVVREQTRAVTAVCERILGPAVLLLQSPLFQGGVLDALQSLLAALAQSGAPEASFDRLLQMLSDAVTAGTATSSSMDTNTTTTTTSSSSTAEAAARCVAALCRSAGQDKIISTAQALLSSLEASSTPDPTRRFALLCLGELGRRSDLSSFSSLPHALTSALSSQSVGVAQAASHALGGVSAGSLATYLPLVLQHIQSREDDPKLQYQLLRALNEAITTAASPLPPLKKKRKKWPRRKCDKCWSCCCLILRTAKKSALRW